MRAKKAVDARTEELRLPQVIPDNGAAIRLLNALQRADELSRLADATLPA